MHQWEHIDFIWVSFKTQGALQCRLPSSGRCEQCQAGRLASGQRSPEYAGPTSMGVAPRAPDLSLWRLLL